MTPLLLVSIIAVVGAAMGLIRAIREERRKAQDIVEGRRRNDEIFQNATQSPTVNGQRSAPAQNW
jgi:hypothetical protein